jgi:hypothetical protein
MAVGVAEVAEGKGPQAVSRPGRAQKEATTSQAATPQARFFLAKAGAGGGTPEFDRECATEAEAIAESFKTGVSYYAVIEYRSLVDCSGKQPQFKKEVVKRNP